MVSCIFKYNIVKISRLYPSTCKNTDFLTMKIHMFFFHSRFPLKI